MANITTVDRNLFMQYYHFLFTELGDPRTHNWFLVAHPIVFPLVAFYWYFVRKLGPRLMQNRPAFDFKWTLVIYNAFQVVVSTWIFLESSDLYLHKYSWKCEPVDFSDTPEGLRVARAVWVFYLAKISELLDTVFFVLRKKNNQATFLHVYHHSVMPMISWGATKYQPGGHGVFVGFINSFVHIIMYSYYMLAAMGPGLQKYLWWKKYITNIQMIQFCFTFVHNSQLLFYNCGYPRWTIFFTLPNAIFFYYLFDDFYNKAYRYDKKFQKKVALAENGHANGKINGYHKEDQNDNILRTTNGKLNGYHKDDKIDTGELQDWYHQKTL